MPVAGGLVVIRPLVLGIGAHAAGVTARRRCPGNGLAGGNRLRGAAGARLAPTVPLSSAHGAAYEVARICAAAGSLLGWMTSRTR